LLLVATNLFGKRGIDAVALKDIVAAAGQRNQSAIQYHFGGKQGLINAALFGRFQAIDARRLEMVEAALLAPSTIRRDALLRATVEPIVIEAETHTDGPNYIRFVAQALQRPDFDAAAKVTSDALPGLAALNRAISRERPRRLPREQAEQRIRMSAKLTMSGVDDWVSNGFGPMPREELILALARANGALLL
jgi:AcrR family transcriptional regulator